MILYHIYDVLFLFNRFLCFGFLHRFSFSAGGFFYVSNPLLTFSSLLVASEITTAAEQYAVFIVHSKELSLTARKPINQDPYVCRTHYARIHHRGVKGQKVVKLQLGKMTKAIFYFFCIFVFALNTVITRTLAAKNESDEKSSPVNNGATPITVQQTTAVTRNATENGTEKATNNATTKTTKKRLSACSCSIYTHFIFWSWIGLQNYWEKGK